VVLGAPVFWVLFMPSFVFAALFVMFFNWAGHNAHAEGATIEPTNLDHGAFWILNRMFFGIFYHGNHHKMARMFNPMNLPLRAASPAAADDE
jgi:stearoyl-CoA desaturase (delta-9 desaturase)